MSMAGNGLLIVLSNSVSVEPCFSNQHSFQPHFLTLSISHWNVFHIKVMENIHIEKSSKSINVCKMHRCNGKEYNRKCNWSARTVSSPHTQHTTSSQCLENKLDEVILHRPNSSLKPIFTGLPHLSGSCSDICEWKILEGELVQWEIYVSVLNSILF